MVQCSNKLIVFGGCDGSEGKTVYYNDVCIYDLKRLAWEFKKFEQIPEGRDGHAAWIV